MSVTDKDRGYDAMVKRVFDFGNPKIKVGILEAEGQQDHGDELTILQVAIWNEFGTKNAPARSFVRAWFDANQTEIRKKLQALMVTVIKGKIRKEQALEQLGQWMVGQIQKRIADGVPPPNAPATIAQKGSSTPLINTGQLRNSVNYRVIP